MRVEMNNPQTDPYMLTGEGLRLYYLNPARNQVSPVDIAKGLAYQPRFNGTIGQYSVAQHCVLCAREAERLGFDRTIALGALLHDAPEAYTGDMVSPLKRALTTLLPGFANEWARIEETILIAIYARAGLLWDEDWNTEEHWTTIKSLDLLLLARERLDLMPKDEVWVLPQEVTEVKVIHPWPPRIAAMEYTLAWNRLTRRNS